MRYVTFTHVDAQTGTPVARLNERGVLVEFEPAQNGPTLPIGCVFGFALSSQYPTNTPTFYGQTDGPLDAPGILSVISKAQYEAAESKEMDARTPAALTPASLPPISDRQFFQALATAPYSIITQQEALDAMRTGEIPQVMQDVIDRLPVDQQFPATALIAGGTIFERTNPLVEVFGHSQGMDAKAIDDFWEFAGGL